MQTSLLTSPSTTSSTPPASSASATSDMFTKLLVAQIQNQDPTAPTDPSTYVNQLAQLSETESLQNVADLTSANSSVLQSLQILAMGAQVGTTVTATTTSVDLGTDPVSGSFTLANASSKADLVLTGSDGLTHTVSLGAENPGSVPFTIDPVALGLAPGAYGIAIQTSTSEVPTVQVNGTLSSVQLSSTGSVSLTVGNLGQIAPSAVTGFNGPAARTPN